MNPTIKTICRNGIVAAIYVALTYLTMPFSFGDIQFRVAEILMILVFFRRDYTIGLTLGCALANIYSTIGILDVLFGTLATLIACLVICFSKQLVVACLAPVIANAFIVGAELYFLLELPFWPCVLSVGLGELAVMAVGYILFMFLRKNKHFMDVIGANRNLEFKF